MRSTTLASSFARIVICLLLSNAARAAITADHANDVCTPTADPCVVTTTVHIVPGSTLDFGARALQLTNSGQLDFGDGAARVLCGDVTISSWGNGQRIQVKENGVGGSGEIVARGRCSTSSSTPCLSNASCGSGTCTGGDIALNDNVRGDGDPAGSLKLVAHRNFSSSDVINLNNGTSSADGGELHITALTGSVTVGGRIELNGGSNATGGNLFIESGLDVTINQTLDLTGGDGGGGSVDIRAERNIAINDDVTARASVGEGVGGDVTLTAGGNVVMTGASTTNNTLLSLQGHTSGGISGNGGSLEVDAGGTVQMGNYVTVRASGPDPDGSGGEIVASGCDVTMSSSAKIYANGGEDGIIELNGSHTVVVGSTSSVEATGSGGSEGTITLATRDVVKICSNNGAACNVNSDCTSGCSSGTCQMTNPDTGGTQAQFVPAPEIAEDLELPVCQ